ncbi:MAG: hypothetical protein Q9214_004076, partial [Letrouitia sp. 1 TL-2023]
MGIYKKSIATSLSRPEYSSSNNNSINTWLDNHPHHPDSYEAPNKRRRTGGYKYLQNTATRQYLAEVSANKIPRPHESPIISGKRTQTSKLPLSKRVRSSIPHAREEEEEDEFHVTPRPTAPQSRPIPGLNPSTFRSSTTATSSNLSSPHQSQRSQQSQSQHSPSKSFKRSRSPSKLGDFGLADIQVELISLGSPGNPVPSDMGVEILVQRLTAMEGGNEVVPKSIKNTVKEHIGNARPLKAANITKKEWEEDKAHVDGSLGYEKMWEQILWVMGEAARCNAERMSEASWNELVHAPVLSLALRGYWMSRGVYFYNIMSARISNKRLIPKIASKSIESKMADYAMVIRPSPMMAQRIRQKLLADGTSSINQTEAEYI